MTRRVEVRDVDEQFWASLLMEFLGAMREAGFTYLTLEDFAKTEYIKETYLYDKMFDFYYRKGFRSHAIAPLLELPRTKNLGRYSGPMLAFKRKDTNK